MGDILSAAHPSGMALEASGRGGDKHTEGPRHPSTSSNGSSGNVHPAQGSSAAGTRPYTAGSEASSVRSSNSNPYGGPGLNGNGLGLVQERSSPA